MGQTWDRSGALAEEKDSMLTALFFPLGFDKVAHVFGIWKWRRAKHIHNLTLNYRPTRKITGSTFHKLLFNNSTHLHARTPHGA